MGSIDDNNSTVNQKKPRKHKLTEEELKALLGKTCPGRQWFLMKKTADFNKLALFLKINGVDKIELGQKAYTYEVDLRDETIGGAFILTEKMVGSVGADGKRIGDDAAGNGCSRAADMEADTDGKLEGSAPDSANGSAAGGSRWYIAAAVVAQDYRGHDIGKIMLNKMKKLTKDEGADAIFVQVTDFMPCPDDIDGAENAKEYWEALGFVDWGDGLLVCTVE